MKKFFKSNGNKLVIIFCSITVVVYFSFMMVVDQNEKSTGNSVPKTTEETTIAEDTTAVEQTTGEINEDLIKKYNTLSKQLKEAQKNSEAYLSKNNEIANFINNQYGKLMQTTYNGTYRENQKEMKKTMSPLFTDEAFLNTKYYELSTEEETYTQVVSAFGSTEMRTFNRKVIYVRKIVRAFYKNITTESGNVFLEIQNENTNQREYEELFVEKNQNKWEISEYKITRQF